MAKIYAIECDVTGFVYVGCTRTNQARRMREARSRLKRRIHTSSKMIDDWHAFGDATFKMRTLEELPDGAPLEVLREAELRWMHHFNGQGRLYNVHLVSFGPGGNFAERAASPEARLKRSIALRGKPKHAGHGAKVSATKRALGQKPSAEAARLGGIAACRLKWSKG